MSTRMLLFEDPAFPYEGARPDAEAERLLAERAEAASAGTLAERLMSGAYDALVYLHGPYVPKAAWSAVLEHLRRGGGLVTAGGLPFRRPVAVDAQGRLRVEREQTAYLRQLDVHEALAVGEKGVVRLQASEEYPLLSGVEPLFGVRSTWGLIFHPTKASDMPHELGSGGPMDARIVPLLVGVDAEGRPRTAPVVLVERLKGPFAGGRWVMINQPLDETFWREGGADVLLRLAEFAAAGATEIWLKPHFACYEPGERPSLTLQIQALGRTMAARDGCGWTVDVEVEKDEGRTRENVEGIAGDLAGKTVAGRVESSKVLWKTSIETQATRDLNALRMTVPVDVSPGLYRVRAVARSERGEVRRLSQAFWGMDRELLRSGEPLACGRDYFVRGGRPMPIVGMTYMAADTARKFLHLPNVEVWDRDMAEMARAGVNLIRTGVWTAHRTFAFVDGHIDEAALRAIDAFLLTAKRHGLEVTFTFFAFAPERWEGLNPYLDPRSVEAQKRFVALVASRHRETTHVHWDLINEPSLFDPGRLFSGPRTLGDPFERKAFADWLRRRHGGDLALLQERWNMTPEELPSFEAAEPPEREDVAFDVADVTRAKHNGRWLDYALFTMDMFNRWTAELRGTIARVTPGRLVTVGQDEALGGQRPSPFFYAREVDYTTVHTWWLMDQLVWDGVFSKTPDKPNLVQETGIMYVERPDGRAKRTEEELRDILERKYAYAFATGAAGAVQWIWNTNVYMDNVNECNIGALRADGTHKPEADVTYAFGRFMAQIRDLFEDREPEPVAVVFPYSNDFSCRSLAFEATARSVRVLVYGLNVHPRGIGEYQLEALRRHPARLIVVPSAHNFDDEAFERLTEAAAAGAVVLWTGPLRLDAYWGPAEHRLRELIGPTVYGNVMREEKLEIGGRVWDVSFGGTKIAEAAVDRPIDVDAGEGTMRLVEVGIGSGRWIWCPLPVELNERWEPIAAVYRRALEVSAVVPELEWLESGDCPGVYGRALRFSQGTLFVFVSECADDRTVRVRDPRTGVRYALRLERGRAVLFAADESGRVIAVYRPDETQVRAEIG
ncbi:MAG: glycoside hydrolase [Candidatus Reconcilbacillus cellulovorans]|uniref:Glycoside hydrolase n=1 Tax=Candidatus Reconcilbacillus cellulovorans TaxID=1906605 RepID=A0A2A6E0C6_9BACL|nr:MAG: glycoside hydrolase [Candidatus Reconcilbacillus cellulovorans]